MRIAVLGAKGMLGKAVCAAMPEATPLSRAQCNILRPDDVAQLIGRYDAVINCAGEPNSEHTVNSIGPWRLARVLENKAHIYHVSTDCVFGDQQSPAPYAYKMDDIPQPTSHYGISKMLGEQLGVHVTNIRTSFVGLEHGLLAWALKLAKEHQPIYGWTNAWWSGSTVTDVAYQIADVVRFGRTSAIIHMVTGKPISKYTALACIIDAFDLDVELREDSHVHINRALKPTNGDELEPFREAIVEFAHSLKQAKTQVQA